MDVNNGRDIIDYDVVQTENGNGALDSGDGKCFGKPSKRDNLDENMENNEQIDAKHDEGDALGTARPTYGEQIARMPTDRYATHYNMGHAKRGIALVFNHEHFAVANLKSRSGTNEDEKNLKHTFHNLGFEVHCFKDLKYHEIEEQLLEVSRRDFSNYDCLIITILSHGEQGVIYAKDREYKADILWSFFTPERCISLTGKPKLFFIQACQGDHLDGGVTLSRFGRTETDGEIVPSYRIPQQADFLVVYSTVKGFYSWRNTTKGSWFVQVLAKELAEKAYDHDLLTILTGVNLRVAVDFESNCPDIPTMHKQKQIPCIMSMLTRLLQFTKKGTESENVVSTFTHEKEKHKRIFSGLFKHKQ